MNNTAPVVIQFPPSRMSWRRKERIEILLDGKLLGNFSVKKGFIIEKNIASGKHTITATMTELGFGMSKTKELPFELNKNEPTVLSLSYSRMWANFNELEVSSINTRLAKLYEEKWPKLRTTILIGAIIIGIIIALYCGYWWNMSSYYTGWQDECIDKNRWDDYDYVGCQEHVNEYYNKDFTLNEITWMVNDSWFFWLIYTIFMTTMVIPHFFVLKSDVNSKSKAIEQLELHIYNRKKEKIEEERRIEAIKAERQRVWLAEKAEIDKKIIMAQNLWNKGGLENLKKALNLYSKYGNGNRKIEIEIANEKEKYLDYESALLDFENLGLHKSARRVRQKINDQKEVKVDQTVIHGDYVDDRDTIVKDSVINRSNIGPDGKSKAEELREAKSLFKEGLIDHNEFKQMKKEILGK